MSPGPISPGTSVAALLQSARAQGVTIATAESCTGGMISAALTDVAGSSDVFDRGFVTYSNAAKIAMLGVQAATLAAHGAVSEQVAAEMAQGALARSEATLAVSVTGIAGPGGSECKPEGRVCFGLARRDAPPDALPHTEPHTETVDFGAIGRAAVRRASTDHALNLIYTALRRRAKAAQPRPAP